MKLHPLVRSHALGLFAAVAVFAQGLETTATKDDWEEINFEFDSAVLTDGYPSLLRLADLLSKNPEYRVQLTGHTDFRGAPTYNVGLGRRRAETVLAFLAKYGASEGQISIATRGEEAPAVSNETDEGRFMNRRVVMEVRNAAGDLVSAGGVGDAIDGIERAGISEECCNQILEKLSKLDEILDLLNNLKRENDQLKQDVAELKQRQPAALEAAEAARDAAAAAPTLADVTRAVDETIAKNKGNQYASFNINAGPSSPDGNLSVGGQARVFVPFGERHAVQTQGEFLHFLGRDEGQVDLGLVSRFGDVQVGGFSSFKFVKFDEWQESGGIGQGAFTLDYIFNRGRVGFFGTKAFLDGAVVNRALLSRNIIQETFLDVVDQVGGSAAISAWGVGGGRKSWFEGNLGALFRRAGDDRLGGTIRYIHPLSSGLALTFEGGLNETFVRGTDDARFVVGLQFGKWLSPDKYKDQGTKPVPVDVPRVRYEVLTREVRTGNDAPVAQAGGDQIGIQPGPVTLDGSASFDPDGDPITFEWAQVAGNPVQLSGAETAVASFTAEEGQNYQFRLTVRDDQGGIGTDRVTVNAVSNEITIRRFSVDPSSVASGETVTIVWEVENADTVEISPGLGEVDLAGTSTVPVTETTVFTLTATKGGRSINESRTVEVSAVAGPRIISLIANPPTIGPGEATVLAWETENADQVNLEVQSGVGAGLGSVGVSGTATVSPSETTTYLLTATNAAGSVNRTVTVTVEDRRAARILEFRADKTAVQKPGDPATLSWRTENATHVRLLPDLGEVEPNASATVNPLGATTYTLIAEGANGSSVQATVTISVEIANRSPIAVAEGPFPILVPAGTLTGRTTLDGTKSSDPDGDPITFEWRAVGSRESVVRNPSSPTPTVEFLGGFGQYDFELMVTDDKGAMSRDSVSVFWVDP